MRSPRSLRKGDTVRIVAPAKKIEREFIDFAKEKFESEGFKVILGSNIEASFGQFAGTDEERLKDLQEAIDDPNTKAIICARGGYGSMRILDKLDWKNFRKKPKWIVGFSDITAFHSYLHEELDICSLHASMPLNYKDNSEEAWDSLILALKGKELIYEFESSARNKSGIAHGVLCGGNLSILQAMRGTPYQLNLKHKILFIEEVSESLYHVDRMFQSMRLNGELEELAGLIIGGMTGVTDHGQWFERKGFEDIILENFGKSHIPVVFDFPAGHIDDNRTLIFGREASLAVGNGVHLNF